MVEVSQSHPERRRYAPDDARARRVEQQHQWEDRQTDPPKGPQHVSDTFAHALGALIGVASRLPTCDRAASLYAAVHRLAAADDRAAAHAAARVLIAASAAALKDDPWMQFHVAALRMAAALDLLSEPRA